MRLKISRHDMPASARIRVCVRETTVLLPFEPLASTVIRTMFFRIRLSHVEEAAETPAGTCFGYRHARIGKYSPMPPGSRSKFICNAQLSSGQFFRYFGHDRTVPIPKSCNGRSEREFVAFRSRSV